MERTQDKTSAIPGELASDAYRDAQTHVTVSRDDASHDMTTIDGDQVRYDSREDKTTRVQGEWPAEADAHVRGLIAQAQNEREARENTRANHRNLNRMLTLMGALLIGLVVTWALYYDKSLPMWAHSLAPFSFVITILMDSGLALYGLIKHY